MYDSPFIDRQVALDHPYELKLSVENVDSDHYDLVTNMKLFGGSFYVSPHAERDFTGRFTIVIEDNDKLVLASEFIETPRSKEVFDPHPFVSGEVNWVSEDTRYDHHLTVISKEDFKVSGMIRFTIEPKCTLEEIPFDVILEDGVLTVQQYPKLKKGICGDPDQTIGL
jgi:hypothetical protein